MLIRHKWLKHSGAIGRVFEMSSVRPDVRRRPDRAVPSIWTYSVSKLSRLYVEVSVLGNLAKDFQSTFIHKYLQSAGYARKQHADPAAYSVIVIALLTESNLTDMHATRFQDTGVAG